MGKKSIPCPICDEPGVLVKEPPRTRKRDKPTNWEVWSEYRTKYPDLQDYDLYLKIIRAGKLPPHFNIPKKAYYRKKNPIYQVYHSKKVNGKWKTKKCYLGVINIKELEDLSTENYELIKPNLIKQLKEFVKDKDKKIQDIAQINKLLAEIINLKNEMPEIIKFLQSEFNKKHKCPKCKEIIQIRFSTPTKEYSNYQFKIV